MKLRALTALAFCLAAQGCATGSDPIQRDISRLEKNLADVRSFEAEQTSQIEALQSEIRGLVGRVEELEYLQRARLGNDISALKENISSLQRRVPPPAIVPAATLDNDELLAQRIGRPEVAKLFMDGLQKIRSGAFAEALPPLQEAYDRNYGENGTAEMVFWKGVAYEGLGDNRKALEMYGSLVTSFPGHSRQPLALLRQGSVFIRMGDFRTADLTFRKLIAEFPRSQEAAQAKERLKDL